MKVRAASVVLILAFAARTANAATPPDPVEPLAQAFASLALQLAHSPGHAAEVDSYFGPASLVPAAAAPSATAAQLSATAQRLVLDISAQQQRVPSSRGARLLDQARTLAALIDELQHPHTRSFAAEAWAVYTMRVPAVQPQATRRTLQALAALLPGSGPVADRLEAYRMRFVVAPERRRVVFERALQECRERTLKHWALPAGERVEVEWSDDVPAAWQRYRGADRSTLQINPQAVAFVGQAIDVACHEAYPGHHAQFVLLTQHAGPTGPPTEDTIALLHSPASVLREGAANFGIELAFPLTERVAFDRNVLFPLAGLDPSQAARYEHVNALVADLAAAAQPILASYRDGGLSFAAAAAALRADALVSSPEALLRFVDEEGAYALGYTAARDSIRAYVTARSACTKEDPWRVLAEVVSVPQVTALSEDGAHCAQATDDPAPVARVVTAQGRYRIDLVAAPNPIPMSKYFTLKLAVYDTRAPTRSLTDVKLDVSAGMTHGAGHEFMHGMESSTVVEKSQDRFLVRGMMFHMAGPWTLRVRVHQGAASDTADLTLQCCGG
jgi:hypothetical protein